MASIPRRSVALKSLFAELKKLHLRPIKKMRFRFDPFHQDSNTLRDFLFHVSSQRIRKTSDICAIRTDIVNDRSDPVLNITLDNEIEVIFKTSNLSTLEITQEFNKVVERFYVPEEEPSVLPSALTAKSSGYKKKNK